MAPSAVVDELLAEPQANGTKAKAAADQANGEASSSDSKADDKTEDGESDSETTEDDKKDDKKDDKEDDKPKEPLAPKGSLSTPKNIYRSAKDSDGNWSWVDHPPKDLPEAAENDATAQYAVLVRNIKSQDSRKKLEAHSLVIQSEWLRKALGEILEGYPGVACELERLEFEAPFHPFVHRWPEYTAHMAKPDLDETTREHLKVLHDILTYEIGDQIRALEDYVRVKNIKFSDLWMILQPGAVIFSAFKGAHSAMQLHETEYMQNQCGRFLRLRLECIDYSGKEFGRSREVVDVPEFIGLRKITSLNAFPLSFHEAKEEVTELLVGRGKLFEDLAGHCFKSYDGTAITWDREGNEVPVQVCGRIVIDIKSFNRFSPYPRRYVEDFNAQDLELLAAHRLANGLEGAGPLRLTPFHHMLCRGRTRGYSLKLKKWLDFYVEHVAEIEWNRRAFDRLVLPEDQKELILAFSESQLDQTEGGGGKSFDDFIAGKGKGVICLLAGPPGVGKTLTAEAVAEHLRVPLHTLSSGDLGSQPWEVEHGLSRILELVARWNAILLLDECDVFLEARSTHDLERNKVVSIFLRTLEYYEGILFMTTNRVDNIDQAFQSRIHVSLEYSSLDPTSRAAIWRNFLGGRMGITPTDIEELAEYPLNGRQIKNVLKTAQLLASRKQSELKRSFIDTVLAIEKRRPGAVQADAA
ncbi:hypothetical protein RB594_004692 [Gaeumannomyces avenae]